MSLQDLAEISRFYGSNPDYVIAGGGNTSFKDRDYLYIKASGASLASARPGDFVKMNRAALAKIWGKTYPADMEAREAAVLADMMTARAPGEEGKRPSVETLLHDILPFAFVVHTHPSLVNGLTCARKGEKTARKLFPGSVWVPSINPGYILSKAVKDAMDSYRAEKGKAPEAIFLQNHGIFVGAESPGEIKAVYGRIVNAIEGQVKRKPDLSGKVSSFGNSDSLAGELKRAADRLSGGPAWFVRFERNAELSRFTAGKDAFKPVSSAFTPDHIVYAGSDPLFIGGGAAEGGGLLEEALKKHREKTGRIPKAVAVQGLGLFGLGNSEKAAGNAVELFNDAVKVAVYTESFGGPLFMPPGQISFINNWEVERYRSKVSSA
ncbi:MAG: class II aldolase/adducin family protein [Treponema sp.]|jgi:rhamnose utilization protein RhaD (predicted bifunctional aldolase and dehydrogenase)|nr:class II aldolase/adducin family protein [Treponema sp.]